MKSSFFKPMFAITLVIMLFSCKKNTDENIETFRGPEVIMGNGKVNSFFTVKKGIPQEIGIEMTSGALTNLTNDPANFAAATFLLQLDQKAKDITPFDHLIANWSPHGHDPAGVFNVPHFDFHFYTITQSERMAITPYMPSTASLHDKLPAAGFMPASFTATPGGVPQMGKHWGDNNMQMPFSHTMIYGSYSGKVNFLEPMVTKILLESGTKISVAYAQPVQFEKTGKYYPTKYNMYKDASTNNHFVMLSDFVQR